MTQIRTNTIAFEGDIAKLSEVLDMPLRQAMAKIAIDTYIRIVDATPVDSGRARASWTLNEGAPSLAVQPPGEYPAFQNNPRGAAQQASAGMIMMGRGVNRGALVYFIANGLPYIGRLNDGYSAQAPAAFVEAAVAEIEATVEQEIEQALARVG